MSDKDVVPKIGEVLCEFEVTSDGTPQKEWVTRLESQGILLKSAEGNVKDMILSSSFVVTPPATTKIVIIRGSPSARINSPTEEILQGIAKQGFVEITNLETICLARERVEGYMESLKEAGIRWVVPLVESSEEKAVVDFNVVEDDDGIWLGVMYIHHNFRWPHHIGLMFARK